MSKVRCSAIILALALSATARAAPPRTITVNEAQDLVRALLKPDGWTKLRGFVLYQALFDAEFQDFFFIHAEWENKPGGHAPIGHFAVERTTGDVWDWVKCGRFSSPSLTQAQQALRNRIGLSDSEYLKIRKPGPFCEPGENPLVFTIGRPKKK
jgi:hypothetical protein